MRIRHRRVRISIVLMNRDSTLEDFVQEKHQKTLTEYYKETFETTSWTGQRLEEEARTSANVQLLTFSSPVIVTWTGSERSANKPSGAPCLNYRGPNQKSSVKLVQVSMNCSRLNQILTDTAPTDSSLTSIMFTDTLISTQCENEVKLRFWKKCP